jgi:exodeoxyribonuclease VII large subunit
MEKKIFFSLLNQRLINGIKNILDKKEVQWRNLGEQLNNLSPLSILKRGYSLCWKEKGQILIKNADQVRIAENVKVTFYRGEIMCKVKKIDKKSKIISSLGFNKNERKKI